MAAFTGSRGIPLLLLALLSSSSLLSDAIANSSFSNLHEKLEASKARGIPLDDFYLMHRCDVAGIIAKFQSWEDRKSDEIGGKLVALAQEMIDYAKFHGDVIRRWARGSPVRICSTPLQVVEDVFACI